MKNRSTLSEFWRNKVESGGITFDEAWENQFGKGSIPKPIPKSGQIDISWKDGLHCAPNGKPYGDEANVMHALRHAPELRGCVRFNEFYGRLEVGRDIFWRSAEPGEAWTDTDNLDVLAWLQRGGIAVRGKATVSDVVQRVAMDRMFHPVRSYLDNLEWDGASRLRTWLAHYLGADANSDYLASIGSKFLISACARIYEPGCQADHVLVLEGRQGVGKTRTLQTLGHPWTMDSLPDLHSKDAALQLSGVWLVELAELAALRRSEVEATKAFISRRVDRYRPPYARYAVDVPRQCVFIATTNELSYLRDPTGNRRFWPVQVHKVDVDALHDDRDKLWAEAVALYREGVSWYLDDAASRLAESENERRVLRTELETCVAEFIDRIEASGKTETNTREVFIHALGLSFPEDIEKSRRLGRSLSQALTACGWQRLGPRGRGENRRMWYGKPRFEVT